jgi:carbonic anhydrase
MIDDWIRKNMESVYRKERLGIKPKPLVEIPKYNTIIITCMSHNINPYDVFGMEQGDAYVIRSAGALVTSETVRCLLIALLKAGIDEVIVLGHTSCSNVNGAKFRQNYARFISHIPRSERIYPMIDTMEKASKYFGFFTNEVEGVLQQVQALQFLKRIVPSIQITGMLYNQANGHVYTYQELLELRTMLQNNPNEKIEDIVPVRYDAFLKEMQANPPPQAVVPARVAAPVQKDIVSPAQAPKTPRVAPTPKQPVERQPEMDDLFKPPSFVVPTIQGMDELKAQEDQTSKAFGLAMNMMQKNISGVSAHIHVPLPRIRPPRVPIIHVRGVGTFSPEPAPVETPAPAPVAKPAPQPSFAPATAPAPKPAHVAKPAAKPAVKPYGRPAPKPAAKPYGRPAAKPYGRPAPKPAAKPYARPAPKPAAKPYGRPAQKPVTSSTPTTQPSP